MTNPSSFEFYAFDEILPYDEEHGSIIRDGGFIITIDEHGNAVCGGGFLPKPIISNWPTPVIEGDDAIQAPVPFPKPILSDWPTTINDPAPAIVEWLDDGGFVITLDKDGNAVCGPGPLPKPILSDWPTPVIEGDDAIQAPGGLPIPKPILSDWPTPANTDSSDKIAIKDVLDTGFVVTVDKDGNAVCGPAFDGLQKSINDFVLNTTSGATETVREVATDKLAALGHFVAASSSDDLLTAAVSAV